VVDNIVRKDQEEHPDLIVLTPTCTSSILQEDLPTLYSEPAGCRWRCDAGGCEPLPGERAAGGRSHPAANRQFYIEKARKKGTLPEGKTEKPSVNIIGLTTLGFHNNHDGTELRTLMAQLGIEVNLVMPDGASVHDPNMSRAWFNLVPFREVAPATAQYLETRIRHALLWTSPPWALWTRPAAFAKFSRCCNQQGAEVDYEAFIDEQTRFVSKAAWFSRSIDCQNLTGKKAVVFGDSTHAAAMTKILAREMGIHVVLAGTYCKYDADWFREQVGEYCDEILSATTMGRSPTASPDRTRRHLRHPDGAPCGQAPGYSLRCHCRPHSYPKLPRGLSAFSWVRRGQPDRGSGLQLLHPGHGRSPAGDLWRPRHQGGVITKTMSADSDLSWTQDGLTELNRIPGFVRGKVKRNTEKFAREQGL
jgi:light-independent protochlorophyllide reductase subunit B